MMYEAVAAGSADPAEARARTAEKMPLLARPVVWIWKPASALALAPRIAPAAGRTSIVRVLSGRAHRHTLRAT